MKHSIVISLYNKAEYIHRTLAGLFQQTLLPAEIIIVDDASTDSSLLVVQEFLEGEKEKLKKIHVELISCPQNGGPGKARNLGFQSTSGDYVSFLDADDEYHPSLLQKVALAITEHQLDFLILSFEMIPSGWESPNLKILEILENRELLKPLSEELFLLTNPLEVVTMTDFFIINNIVARRESMKDIFFDEKVRFYEVIDYWYRVLKVLNLPEARVGLLMGKYLKMYETSGSLSRKNYHTIEEIDFPPLLSRLTGSPNIYDQRLMKIIGKRWFFSCWQRVISWEQKIIFIIKYFRALLYIFF